jgi:hypothetical protein
MTVRRSGHIATARCDRERSVGLALVSRPKWSSAGPFVEPAMFANRLAAALIAALLPSEPRGM